MGKIAPSDNGDCIVELGLKRALAYAKEQSKLVGEDPGIKDLGIKYVEAWCRSHWRRFQRRCRVQHLFGQHKFCQFDAWQFGLWTEDQRDSNEELDLVVGKYESGSENLDFVRWPGLQEVSQEALNYFAILDPNWPRFGIEVIIQMAKEILPPLNTAADQQPPQTPPAP